MKALEVFTQQDGAVTKAYYAELEALGPAGHIAVCLFRIQKRSSRAKDYTRGKYRRAAYDVKAWSMSELCAALSKPGSPITSWGWKQDTTVVFGEEPSWVLYVDLPAGQCSFHSPRRMAGPDYPGEWDGAHRSAERIIEFCDQVQASSQVAGPQQPNSTSYPDKREWWVVVGKSGQPIFWKPKQSIPWDDAKTILGVAKMHARNRVQSIENGKMPAVKPIGKIGGIDCFIQASL